MLKSLEKRLEGTKKICVKTKRKIIKNIVVKADEYKKEHIRQQKDPRHNQWQEMRQKDTKWILGLLGSVLLGLSTWVLVEVVELRSTVSMMSQELLNIDKQFGRVYNFIDKFLTD